MSVPRQTEPYESGKHNPPWSSVQNVDIIVERKLPYPLQGRHRRVDLRQIRCPWNIEVLDGVEVEVYIYEMYSLSSGSLSVHCFMLCIVIN